MKFSTVASLLLFSAAAYAGSGDFGYYPKNQEYYEYRSPRESVWQFLEKYGNNYQQAFFDAAKYGYNDLLVPLLDLGTRINGANKEGKTALAFAAESGNFLTCRKLIILGANVNAQTNWGSTPLMWAAQNGHKKACRILLEDGAKISACTNDGKTALMYAAEHGHTAVCELLLKHRAFVDVRTNWGSTALMWAAQKGHKETCRLLVQHGANVNARTNFGKTVLDYAKGYRDVANFLRNAGAYSNSAQGSTDSKPKGDSGDGFLPGFLLGALVSYGLTHLCS